jgi:hypothetical protein
MWHSACQMQSSLGAVGRRWTLPVAVLAVTFLALVLRAPGLDPPSLYLDDVWVGALTRIESIGKMAALHAPHALGFLLLEWLARRAFHDPEWSLQVLPFVAGLLLIPLSARLVFKLTRNTGSAFLAAALVALSPVLSAYSVRAKPFAFDALATCVLLLAAAGCLEKPSLRRLAGLGSLAVLATLLSFPALLTSAVLLPLIFGWWFFSAREPHRVRRAALLGALVGSSLGLIWFFLMHQQANQSLLDYWRSGYLPHDSLSSAARFLSSRTVSTVVPAFPSGVPWLGFLCLVGLVAAFARRELRWVAFFSVTLAGGLILASALRLYPLGDSRTGAFLIPIFILLVALSPELLGRGSRAAASRTLLGWGGALALLIGASRWETYVPSFPCNDAVLVNHLQQRVRPEDGLLIYPHANWTVGYYGSWPIDFRRNDNYGTRFDVIPRRARTFLLSGKLGYEERPELLDPELQALAARRYPRVFYIATFLGYRGLGAHLHIQRRLEQAGYVRAGIAATQAAELVEFELR